MEQKQEQDRSLRIDSLDSKLNELAVSLRDDLVYFEMFLDTSFREDGRIELRYSAKTG